MSFAELGLSRALVRAVDALNYTEPTPVQAKAIPVILKGRDVVALAETGSGKTAGYLLPILQQLELAYDPFTATALGRTFKIGLSKRFGGD